jgi:opacity protein-like surface antigen
LIAIALVAAGGAVHAQPAPPDPGAPDQPAPAAPPPATSDPGSATGSAASAPAASTSASDTPATAPDTGAATSSDDEVADQAISAELGVAAGGRVTPGGLRIAGRYLYQLAEDDWFEGAASFTFGSGRAACFRDRQNLLVCSHGLAEGAGIELTASVRRLFTPQGAFRPFARVGVGLGLVRFGDDDVSGFTIPAHAGGGLRVAVAPAISVVAEADLALGFGSFSHGLGNQLQFGLAITAGAEFRLR